MMDLNDLRADFGDTKFLQTEFTNDPLVQFEQWLADAIKSELKEPNAMVLSTVDEIGKPSSRVVLLKSVSQDGLVFYTNYKSRKGEEIACNPMVSALFFWSPLERQIRIKGIAKRISAAESDAYFNSRPKESKLSAIVSPQSQEIPNRKYLSSKINELKNKDNIKLLRPEYWGGYRIEPQSFEFWQGRANRLHDRFFYFRHDGLWNIKKLAP